MKELELLFKNIHEYMDIEVFVKILVGYFFLVWVALIIWVLKDITNRTNSFLLQLLSIFIIVFLTPLGLPLYLMIRPSKTNLEKMLDEVDFNLDLLGKISSGDFKENNKSNKKEEKNDDIQIDEKKLTSCKKCNYKIFYSFNYCPNCGEETEKKCYKCNKKLEKKWNICPYCEEEIVSLEDEKKEKEKTVKEKKISKEKND